MKTRKTNQKLVLNKLTLVNLRSEELTRIRGGSQRNSCVSESPVPDSMEFKACEGGHITWSVCR